MKRIFGIIAMTAVLMIVAAAGGIYWFSAQDAEVAKRQGADAIAKNIAASLGEQVALLQANADGVAKSADVMLALQSRNALVIKATEAKLQALIPFNLRLRLLLPDASDIDQSQTPHMGFGDLEMVRLTLTSDPKPVIQGGAEDRHLAVTSAVRDDQQVLGVVLLSLEPNLPSQWFSRIQFVDGLLVLKQQDLVLAGIGDQSLKVGDPLDIPVPNSRWTLQAWVATSATTGDMTIMAALVAVPVLFSVLMLAVCYRKLQGYFRLDQASILKATKDMMLGKHVGNYPMQMEEMQPIISAIVQFKRVISQENSIEDGRKAENEDDGFFDESFDLELAEEVKKSQQADSVPVSVQEMAKSNQGDKFTIGRENVYSGIKVDWEDEEAAPAPSTAVPEPVPSTAPAPLPAQDFSPLQELSNVPTQTKQADQSKEPSFGNVFGSSKLLEPSLEYGFRGLAGQDIDEKLAGDLGKAFASEVKQQAVKTIVVARDSRPSSAALAEALINGIIACGCDVLDLGLVPMPVLSFVAHHTDGRAGVMISGGDFSEGYNGLKMIWHDQALSREQLQGLNERLERGDYSLEPSGSVERNTLFTNEYIGIISEDLHIGSPVSVVVDCVNGACSQLVPSLLRTMGCEVIELNCEPAMPDSGAFSGPGGVDVTALSEAVKQHQANIGLAFSADGERVCMVDSDANLVAADRLMVLFAHDVLSQKTGAEIIYDAASSKYVPEQIKKRGGHPVLWGNGSAYLHRQLKQNGAAMAADMDGHFLFNDRWFGFSDGLYAAARMIAMLSGDMRPSAELFESVFTSLDSRILYVPMAEGQSEGFVQQMLSKAQFDNVFVVKPNGMRAEFYDGWGLVRSACCSPALQLRFEADNQAALERIQAEFKALMLKIKPDLSLPF